MMPATYSCNSTVGTCRRSRRRSCASKVGEVWLRIFITDRPGAGLIRTGLFKSSVPRLVSRAKINRLPAPLPKYGSQPEDDFPEAPCSFLLYTWKMLLLTGGAN